MERLRLREGERSVANEERNESEEKKERRRRTVRSGSKSEDQNGERRENEKCRVKSAECRVEGVL